MTPTIRDRLVSPTNLVVHGKDIFAPRLPADDFEIQLALARRRISPGPLDGVWGPQSETALRVFQTVRGLAITGYADEETRAQLQLTQPPLGRYVVTAEDLRQLHPVSPTWLGKSQQDQLAYESILEMVGELSQSNPKLIRAFNPSIDWSRVSPGTVVTVPNAVYPADPRKAAFIRISLFDRMLQAYDAETNLLVHFPCSIGRQAEKRPVGRLEVVVMADNPNYTFSPQLYANHPEARRLNRKLIIPPGPNNPVGVAWIGLNRPGYGIHGTPEPEKVGRTESHGCFRLANWNAAYLMELVCVSMPVYVEE